MSALTEDERATLLQIGGWPVLDLLVDPASAIPAAKASHSGGSFTWGGKNCWRETRPKGIAVVANLSDPNSLVMATWSAITRFANDIPADVKSQLARVRDAHRTENMRFYELTAVPTGQNARRATKQEWAEHIATTVTLDAAIKAALTTALTKVPVQLDLFSLVQQRP